MMKVKINTLLMEICVYKNTRRFVKEYFKENLKSRKHFFSPC